MSFLDPQHASSTLEIFVFLSAISLAPSLLIMLTSFVRIMISLSFLRSALGTQQMPPSQVLIGLALFLTLFVMGPIFTEINDTALKPYTDGALSASQAIDAGMKPLRRFMLNQAEDKDMALFMELSGETYDSIESIPNRVLMPAFMLGELTKGFKIGFIIYLPFIAIDMVVASILMAMGMMMLPPAMISLPFKLLLFIMSGGWSFLVENLVRTFRF
ncbi:MAG: flagellar type III secretion system pore protein FliP [Clostridiales bacterium]|jgi:flagellar biosynthetic protein FliP|nr:flagellar type III secretion system pore protein FliP [Clostridiales bacterium]MDR2752402.1 flagellar type III secretion system pore protein FliP [Clostridiales bacterium]